MSDVSALSGSRDTRIETPATEGTGAAAPSTPPVETEAVERIGGSPVTAPPLRPMSKYPDSEAVLSEMKSLGSSIEVVAGLFAVMMERVQNELSRAAKEEQNAQVDERLAEKRAAAAQQRNAAVYTLIGTEFAAGGQVASAAINIGGGVQGMRLTSSSAATTSTTETDEVLSESPAASLEASGTLASATDVEAELNPASTANAESSSNAEQSQEAAQDVEAEASRPQRAKAAKLAKVDETESERLAARAQNIALLTQGLAGLTTAAGDGVQGILEYDAQRKRADATEADARADERDATQERTKDFADAMQKGVDAMIEEYQQVMDNKAQTDRQIWSQA